jgi:hypothetical protein
MHVRSVIQRKNHAFYNSTAHTEVGLYALPLSRQCDNLNRWT